MAMHSCFYSRKLNILKDRLCFNHPFVQVSALFSFIAWCLEVRISQVSLVTGFVARNCGKVSVNASMGLRSSG